MSTNVIEFPRRHVAPEDRAIVADGVAVVLQAEQLDALERLLGPSFEVEARELEAGFVTARIRWA